MKHICSLKLVLVPLILVLGNCGDDDSSSSTARQPDAGPGDSGGEGEGGEDPYVPPERPGACTDPAPESVPCSDGFCTLPAGCFLMGSPPRDFCRDVDELHHWVQLTGSFRISTTEVTQDQFRAVMGYDSSLFGSCGGNCPVERVSWHEAAAYTRERSLAEGLTPCYECTGTGYGISCSVAAAYAGGGQTIYDCPGYRLPTEAEWEYAYRAGTSNDFYTAAIRSCYGADEGVDAIGWYHQNSADTPHPVAGKAPNAWGLYDMAGNIEEWVHDGYVPYPAGPVVDPVQAVPDENRHSARGGSWFVFPKDLRAADRNTYAGTLRDGFTGFRVVRSVGPAATVP